MLLTQGLRVKLLGMLYEMGDSMMRYRRASMDVAMPPCALVERLQRQRRALTRDELGFRKAMPFPGDSQLLQWPRCY
ncbi:hypothetical protein [Mumia zhuanghuii]|uniref:Uncharacterized protein n=1 Tax=Mumia zhuanghuii TaxID=2585211 RepID=A0A5C4M674_9ACTN|nr:hypothetical protein [Mumia zhuanghuii]TNC28431.1 hypothetical protein FHE65_33975 [Mumia zhuanghuii]